MESGASRYDFQAFEKRASVAPSTTRWSPTQLTVSTCAATMGSSAASPPALLPPLRRCEAAACLSACEGSVDRKRGCFEIFPMAPMAT